MSNEHTQTCVKRNRTGMTIRRCIDLKLGYRINTFRKLKDKSNVPLFERCLFLWKRRCKGLELVTPF